MNRRSKVAGALALGVMLLGGGIAGALWAASGSGSGEANAVTAQVVTVSAATGAADLYPGFTGGDVFFTVTNANPYSVMFSSMAVGTVTSSDPVGCPSSSVSVASATGLNAGRRSQRHVGHAIDRRCGHDGRRCAGCVPGRDLHDRVDALRFSGLTVQCWLGRWGSRSWRPPSSSRVRPGRPGRSSLQPERDPRWQRRSRSRNQFHRSRSSAVARWRCHGRPPR